MRLYEIAKKPTVASTEQISKLKDLLKELEREAIMLRFKISAPTGKYKNEIQDVASIGTLTSHPARDKIFINLIIARLNDIKKLLSREPEYITIKRIAAIRQRCFVLYHLNRNAGRARKNWDEKSAKFLAGKLLIHFFDKYFTWHELRD